MGSSEQRFMERALELALSVPFTSPNPRVGAVLVKDGRIVGEGAHEGAGTPHAEAVALHAAGDTRGATLYVTLEPCTHVGRTPACAPALIEAGIAGAVVAMADPDPRVGGSGLELLRGAGIDVDVGFLEERAKAVNAPYVHQRRTGRAWLTLKLALTLDGRVAAADGSSRWITGEAARSYVHRRRVEADAVMVGSGTVVHDDPALTVRAHDAARQPAAIVVDPTGRVAADAALLGADRETMVATHEAVAHERRLAWKEAGAEVLVLPALGEGVDLGALLHELGRRGMLEVYCEGGAGLATALLRGDLVDRLELHHGAVLVGAGGPAIGDLGITSMGDASRWKLVSCEVFDDDVMTTYERRE